jgi:septal ring factor EnvC (AmiA/AmiB activator)
MALSVQQQKQTETEIAVLQVQYKNLDEKFDDLKTGLKDLRDHIDDHMQTTHTMIKDFQTENKKQHDEVNKKVNALEKWRWMLMGAGILAGALGWPALSSLLGM